MPKAPPTISATSFLSSINFPSQSAVKNGARLSNVSLKAEEDSFALQYAMEKGKVAFDKPPTENGGTLQQMERDLIRAYKHLDTDGWKFTRGGEELTPSEAIAALKKEVLRSANAAVDKKGACPSR